MPDTSNWVIMAYMNGNNELEPETVAAMREMEETVKQTSKTLLFLQIGRLAEKTVHILRPELTNSPSCNPWNGVRRYAISQSGKVLLGELGESNMKNLMVSICYMGRKDNRKLFLTLFRDISLLKLTLSAEAVLPADAAPPNPQQPSGCQSCRKMLIVEDNQVNRLVLKKMLSQEYGILEAPNGKAGLDILHSGENIQAVLLDIFMLLLS